MKILIGNDLANELKIKYQLLDEDIKKLNKILNHKTFADMIKEPLYDKYREIVWFCMARLDLRPDIYRLILFDMDQCTLNSYLTLVEEYKSVKNTKFDKYNDRIFYDFITFLIEKVDFSTYNKISDILIGLGNTFKTCNPEWSQKAFSAAEKLEKDFGTNM